MNNDQNPFRQPEGYHLIRFIVPQAALLFADAAFEDVAVSFATFEADPDGITWQVDVLTELALEVEDIRNRLSLMGTLAGCLAPEFETQYLQQRDWVSEVQKGFPPMQSGRYFIYGSHHTETLPAGVVPIQIDAGMAFGSGEHETTFTCLQALNDLAKTHHFSHMLDLGCGSGILAIAMVKTWRKPVIASDIDSIAVDVTRENGEKNGVAHLMETCTSDGYKHPLIRTHAPYDLIVANILARPLVMLAHDLNRHLAKDGMVVLSGLLGRQESRVLSAHRRYGLTLKRRYARNGWHTLVLQRKLA